MKKRRITMKDVARFAKVDPSTVSLALRNDRRLPVETRQRIVRMAKQMGYCPNPLLSALGAARRARRDSDYGSVIAFVTKEPNFNAATDPYLKGANKAAEGQGYRVEAFLLGENQLTEERLDQILWSRGIQGIIIGGLPEAHGYFHLNWAEFCTVALHYTFTDPVFDRVVHDSYSSMRLILEKCRERGLRRVGLALATSNYERNERLYGAAFWVEQKTFSHSLAPVPPLILEAWDEGVALHWMNRHGLDAVVTSNDFKSKFMRLASSHGLKIPGDLSFVNLNVLFPERISGIHVNMPKMGEAAASLVIDKIHRNDRGVPAVGHTVLLPGRWFEGRTLRKA